MWMVPHTLAGVTAVETIQNPILSLPTALMSHYLLDFIPHWNQIPTFYGKNAKYLYIDFFIALGIGLFFAFQYPFGSYQFWIVIVGAALGNIPDAIRIPVLIKRDRTESTRFWLYDFIERFHHFIDQDVQHEREDLVWKFMKGRKIFGILAQVAVCIFCFWLLL